MTTYARIDDEGVVVEVLDLGADKPYQRFTPNIANACHAVDHHPGLGLGWTTAGSTDEDGNLLFTPPPGPSVADLREARKVEVAARRKQAETAGITVNGVPVPTDEDTQAKVTGAITLMENDPTLTTIDWKAGSWLTLDMATLKAIGTAIGRHVESCFSNERAHAEALDALTTAADIAAHDISTGWPA